MACGCKKKKQNQVQEPSTINTTSVQTNTQQTVTEEDKTKIVNEIIKKLKSS